MMLSMQAAKEALNGLRAKHANQEEGGNRKKNPKLHQAVPETLPICATFVVAFRRERWQRHCVVSQPVRIPYFPRSRGGAVGERRDGGYWFGDSGRETQIDLVFECLTSPGALTNISDRCNALVPAGTPVAKSD